MRLWKRIAWKDSRQQIAAEEFLRGLGGRTPISIYGIIFLSILLVPHILFGKSLEKEFIEGMDIKPVPQKIQVVNATRNAKIHQSDDRTLFDMYLDEDRPLVKEDLLQTLEESVELMQVDPTGALIIEAYCDRRGSGAYSLALGHRRVWQIREFVQNLGIPRTQIHSASYGKENPQCRDTSRNCWEENVRIQSTFQYIAISEPKLGCLGRLRIQGGKDLQLPGKSAQQFLQKIRLAPSKSIRSPHPSDTHQH